VWKAQGQSGTLARGYFGSFEHAGATSLHSEGDGANYLMPSIKQTAAAIAAILVPDGVDYAQSTNPPLNIVRNTLLYVFAQMGFFRPYWTALWRRARPSTPISTALKSQKMPPPNLSHNFGSHPFWTIYPSTPPARSTNSQNLFG